MTPELEPADYAEAADGYQCSLCNKVFSRRDLRNRHRRRCEKSIGKPRPSKKRSCEACGKSKLKCDLQHPACSRCISRGIACEYPPETTIPLPISLSTQVSSASSFTPDQLSGSDPLLNDSIRQSFQPLTDPPMSHEDFYAQAQMNSLPVDHAEIFDESMDGLLYGSTTDNLDAYTDSLCNTWDPTAFQSMAGNDLMPGKGLTTDATFPGSLSFSPADFNNSQTNFNNFEIPASSHVTNNSQTSFFQTPSIRFPSLHNQKRGSVGSISEHYAALSLGSGPANPSREKSSDNLTMPVRPPSSSLGQTPSTSSSSLVGHELSPASSNTTYSTMQSASQTSLSQSRSVSAGLIPTNSSSTVGAADIINAEDAARMICDYPRLMLDKEHWSPFIHHKLYRLSDGGLSEPIAVALCCISANMHRVESSKPFVYKLIDEQRSKLVDDFSKKDMDLEQICGSLLALCIYQIESMLALRHTRSFSQSLSGGELHHHCLLKMTECICRNNTNLLCNVDNEGLEWRTWQFAETLRRIVTLANMVNDLCFSQKAISPQYYEPLDEVYTLDLPLPAPESMWKAIGQAEWEAARDSTKWTQGGVLTVRQAIGRLKKGDNIGDMQSLQKLVLSCAWRRAITPLKTGYATQTN